MRSFEERKAEIFRRSENIIKKRRQLVNRAALLCVSFSVGLLVFFSVKNPKVLVNSDVSSESSLFDVSEIQNGLSVESSKEVLNLIDSIFEESSMKPSGGYLGAVETEGTEKSESEEIYKITLNKEDGTSVVYSLKGYVLTNETTKKSVTLTKEERTELLELIGEE